MTSPPADLTPSQWAAVDHRDGPLLVLAGPGSGKTRVITRRIARLIEGGVSPRQILAITFTNKAANEMAARVQALLPGTNVWVSTFHRLCARLLRRFATAVGLQPNFSILDTGDQKTILRQVMTDLNIDPIHYPLAKIGHRIGAAKHRMQSAEMMARGVQESRGGFLDQVVAKVYVAYQKALLDSNAVDFDDLLLHVCALLAENEEIRGELDNRFRYVLVDEYQDTNLAQYQIIAALSQEYPNLCATGDPDQSIYGWRGAEIGNILRFEADYPNAKVVRLEQNYRSTKSILRAADSLIAHNFHRKAKTLFTDNADGTPVEMLGFINAQHEADGIAETIRRLASEESRNWSDFALFYRVNSLSRELEHALGRAGIPYQVAAGVAFYERAEIKDVIGYLRLIHNPADRTAFLRVVNTPLRGIGKTSQTKLSDWAAEQNINLLEASSRAAEVPGLGKKPAGLLQKFAALVQTLAELPHNGVAELIEAVIDETAYTAGLRESTAESDLQRLANVDELLTAARQYDEQHPDDGSLEGFLEAASLVADVDGVDERAGKVTLMTLHAAKGLEFPVVFIVAVEQNLLPHERSLRENSLLELEEERRLLFVGVTRAEERLYLTQTISRDLRGQHLSTIPSQFLDEMELKYTTVGGTSLPDEIAPLDEGDSPHDDFDEFDDRVAGSEQREGPGNDWHAQSNAMGVDASPSRRTLRADAGTVGYGSINPVADAASVRTASAPKMPLLTTAAELLKGTAAPTAMPQSFTVGMSVRHPQLGLGKVIDAQGTGKWRTVTVEFTPGNPTTFIAHKCPLQPVGVR